MYGDTLTELQVFTDHNEQKGIVEKRNDMDRGVKIRKICSFVEELLGDMLMEERKMLHKSVMSAKTNGFDSFGDKDSLPSIKKSQLYVDESLPKVSLLGATAQMGDCGALSNMAVHELPLDSKKTGAVKVMEELVREVKGGGDTGSADQRQLFTKDWPFGLMIHLIRSLLFLDLLNIVITVTYSTKVMINYHSKSTQTQERV